MRPRSYSLATRVAILALLAVPSSAFAQGARPLAIEDFYKVKTVASPTLSPDARWVSFVVSTRIEENNGTHTEVWLAAADGSVPAK